VSEPGATLPSDDILLDVGEPVSALGDGAAFAEDPSDSPEQLDSTAPATSAPSSLFARMGLINMFDDAETADPAPEHTIDHEGTEHTDFLSGDASDNWLSGAGGGDDLHGGDGPDTLHGKAGNDLLLGGAGADALYGHADADTMSGEEGDDTLHGGMGDDALEGDIGHDALLGREGADTLSGGLGEDTLFGGWDNDLIDDVDGTDYLNGGEGADTIAVGDGDVATGGADEDTFVLGEWMTSGSASLTDFDAQEDQLMIVFDDSETEEEPEVEVRVSATDPTLSEIVLDGVVLSTLPTADAPTPETLVLVGESVVAQLSLAGTM